MATDATRAALLDAAAEVFADHGAFTGSLVEITRRAGQRNRAAVHYHFGGREGLLAAVLDRHADFMAEREGELLAVARAQADDDVASVVEAIVRPVVEVAESGWRGRCYLVILSEIVELDPANLDPAINEAIARTGGKEVYALLTERMPRCDDALLVERLSLLTSFVVGSVARRARAGEGGRPQLPTPRFTEHLIDLATAIATAPVR